jgi:hypothetical protein
MQAELEHAGFMFLVEPSPGIALGEGQFPHTAKRGPQSEVSPRR